MKNAIKEGKIALEDKEGIDKKRKSVPVNAEDVNLDEDCGPCKEKAGNIIKGMSSTSSGEFRRQNLYLKQRE